MSRSLIYKSIYGHVLVFYMDFLNDRSTAAAEEILSAVNPDCSAPQSENNESDNGMKNGGSVSGFKPVKSKRTNMLKGQRSRINTKG